MKLSYNYIKGLIEIIAEEANVLEIELFDFCGYKKVEYKRPSSFTLDGGVLIVELEKGEK